MLFPVLVHKDPDSCYGVTIPDIPGCFTAGDTLNEALKNVAEAVECHLHDSGAFPEQAPLEQHLARHEYADGFWVLVDIDLSFLARKHKRVNITIPEDALKKIDAAAKKRGISRSAFLVQAAEREMMGERL